MAARAFACESPYDLAMHESEDRNVSSAPSIGASPTSGSDRIGALDVLRGFAILGILAINIQAFGMIGAAYLNPTASGRMGGLDTWVWGITFLFFDQKFMTLFTLLFGAGIVLMTSRAEASGRPVMWLHYRRQVWLLALGLAHAYLLWTGDILVLYAVTAFWTVWLRRFGPVVLASLGILVLAVGSALSIATQLSMPFWSPADLAGLAASWAPSPDAIATEIAAMRGGWAEQMTVRIPATRGFHTVVFATWGIWRAGGLFLIGMALFKWGIITGERSRQFYRRLALVGLGLGIPVVLYGIRFDLAADFAVEHSMFGGVQFNYWGSIPVSMGYLALVMLAVKSAWLPALQERLAACGQMALTNYLTQTLICTFIFYGHGLGLFETMDRAQQWLVVLAVWGLQLVWSPIWLSRFRFGPFEWAWRSLTYMRLQPLRRPLT
jgi:uncharacterized protein